MCTPRRRRSLGARARDHPILILEVRVVGVVQYRWENARQVERAAHLTRLAAREVLTEVKPKHTRARKHPRGAVCRTLLSSLRIVFAARPSFGPSSCVLSDASVRRSATPRRAHAAAQLLLGRRECFGHAHKLSVVTELRRGASTYPMRQADAKNRASIAPESPERARVQLRCVAVPPAACVRSLMPPDTRIGGGPLPPYAPSRPPPPRPNGPPARPGPGAYLYLAG